MKKTHMSLLVLMKIKNELSLTSLEREEFYQFTLIGF